MDESFCFERLRTADDVEKYLELIRRVFGKESRVDLMVKKWIDHHPTMTLDDFFVIKHDSRIVAALCLIPSEWCIGEIRLKVVELGCVATLPEYRHLGLQRRLMTEYHKRVSEHQCDISVIEGIPYFYRQFGYEYALPLDELIRVKFDEVPEYDCVHSIQAFTSNDMPEAMELLAKSQRKFHAHAIRSKGIWKMQQETRMAADYEFEDYLVKQEGRAIAYFRTSQDRDGKVLYLREITDVDPSAAQSILKFLKDTGLQRGLETLVCTISQHEPIAKYLVATGHAEQPQPYAWQIRVTNHLDMFRKMKTLLEEHLESSAYAHLTENINLDFYRYTIRLTIENGAIKDVQFVEAGEDRVARFNPTAFTQLLLGYRSREELERTYPDFIVRPSHRDLIDVLFPKLPSYIHTTY